MKFRFVLMDRYISLDKYFDFMTGKGRTFIATIKGKFLIALNEEEREKKRLARIDELNFLEKTPAHDRLKGYTKEVRAMRQVF